jgi:hypothetical protein
MDSRIADLIEKAAREELKLNDESEMRSKGYRMITISEYKASMAQGEANIKIWRPITKSMDDDETAIAFISPLALTLSCATDDDEDQGSVEESKDGTDSATTLSAAETHKWGSDGGGHTSDMATFESQERVYIANEGMSTADEAVTLWGDLRF